MPERKPLKIPDALLARYRAGETTWEKLESQGRCRPPNPEALRRYRAGPAGDRRAAVKGQRP